MTTESHNQDNTDTDSASNEDKQEQMFTQEQMNNAVTTRLAKQAKKFEGIDVSRYNAFIAAEEQQVTDDQVKRGDYNTAIKDLAEKKDSRIGLLEAELQKVKVDGAMLNAANKHNLINPEQFVLLSKAQVRVNSEGVTEVVDTDGKVRHNDSGDLMSIDDLTLEFSGKNPHFIKATPSGSGTHKQGNSSVPELDITKLDMKDPDDVAKWKEERKRLGIA